MSGEPCTGRFWVLGGQWVDDGRHLSWPRVIGPYRDYPSALAGAEGLNRLQHQGVRYLVVADVPEPAE